jgi:hypothetical protein
MLLAPLPFEYITYLEPGDRRRRARSRPSGVRVRRIPAPNPDEV